MKVIKAHRLRFLSSISKYAIGITIAALPLTANAFDFTPDPSRVLSDPAYLPLQGQVAGTTTYNYARETYDVNNNLGVQTRSSTFTANDVGQTIAYGVVDDFTIRATESYDRDKTRNDTTGTDTNSNGFTDPTFAATWRALDQKTYPVNVDIIGSYAPNWIHADGASTSEDGTVARGGQIAEFGAAVSYKTKDFTIYGEGQAEYLGNRDVLNANGSTSSYDSNWDYIATLATQTRLTDALSLNLGASETFNNNTTITNDTTLIANNYSPGDVTNLNAALNYHFIPNVLVGSLTYAHDFVSNSSNNFAVAASDTTTTNEKEDVFGVTLRYVFN